MPEFVSSKEVWIYRLSVYPNRRQAVTVKQEVHKTLESRTTMTLNIGEANQMNYEIKVIHGVDILNGNYRINFYILVKCCFFSFYDGFVFCFFLEQSQICYILKKSCGDGEEREIW